MLPAETKSELLRAPTATRSTQRSMSGLARGTSSRMRRSPRTCKESSPRASTRCAPEDKSLLQDAAVVGKVFWLGAVTTVGSVSPRPRGATLHSLERREFIRRARRGSVEWRCRVRLQARARARRRLQPDPPLRPRGEAPVPPQPGSARSATIAPRTAPRCSPTTTARRCNCSRRRESPQRRSLLWRATRVSRQACGRGHWEPGRTPWSISKARWR